MKTKLFDNEDYNDFYIRITPEEYRLLFLTEKNLKLSDDELMIVENICCDITKRHKKPIHLKNNEIEIILIEG